ncbi:MAG: Tm-1-like ATP-binding domain-containing protein [Sulfitobacter sp.]
MKKAYIVGTADTKGPELTFVRDLIAKTGTQTVLVNVGTRGGEEVGDVSAAEVAACHPSGPSAVFVNDRGKAVMAMSDALLHFMQSRDDVGGIIGLGGSGGSSLVAPAMQVLEIGIPKVLVSTLASGDVSAFVGAADVNIFHPVTDVQGLNRVSRQLLGNAAHALAGMMNYDVPSSTDDRRALVFSMFGVTTAAVQSMVGALDDEFDCLVFHATGTGGRAMELLVDQGNISGVMDITTTEVCDMIVGGVLSASSERFDAIARSKVPYVGSCGALDMVNFWARGTVPDVFNNRNLYVHNAQITLMRTTPEECAKIGTWIGNKLNSCDGDVRFLLPLKGVSALDIEGGPFWDPSANDALFSALRDTVKQTERRQLIEFDLHINDAEFAASAVSYFKDMDH